MRIPPWLFLVGVIGFVVLTIACSAASFVVARQVAVDLGESGIAVASFSDFLRAQPTPTATRTPAPTATLLPGVTASPTLDVPAFTAPTATLDPLAGYTWDDPRRVNILLLGIDQRAGETGAFRADTMMLISIDPVRKTIGMLSIPRDLWVAIPGYRQERINNANYLGDLGNYPGGGGPALAARTVTETFGIQVERYIRVNFDVFTRAVELIAPDGAEVCPDEPIDDASYPDGSYGVMRVTFPAGCQRLRAVELLQYARTRHGNTDFERAARQQEVIQSLREEVISAGGIANFLLQVPALWEALSGSYATNLTQAEIISLATLVQEIPRENIRTGVIDYNYASDAVTATGDQVLILNNAAVRDLLQQVFNPQPDLTLAQLRERALAENATITIFNNTTVAGLAGQTRDWLASRQVTVATVGNVPEPDSAATMILHYTGKTWTARYLAALMGLPSERVAPSNDGATTNDIAIVVGTDVQPLLTGQ